MSNIKYIITLLLLMAPLGATAAVSFSVDINKHTFEAGERIYLKYSINSSVSDFVPPKFSPLFLLRGPDIEKIGDIVNYNFILRAQGDGYLTINPAKITIEGNDYYSNEITVKIINRNEKTSKTSNQPKSVDDIAQSIFEKYLFIEAISDKDNYLRGENIIVSYMLYVHNDIVLTEIIEQTAPLFGDFWVEEEHIGRLSYQDQTIDGESYRVALLRRYTVNSLDTGEYDLPELALAINAALQYQPNYQRAGYYQKKLLLKSASPTIKISSSNFPSDFSGGIGNFRLTSEIDRAEIDKGEIFNYRVKISGKGNFHLIKPPQIHIPDGFSLIGDAMITDSLQVANGIIGSRTWKYEIKAETDIESSIFSDIVVFDVIENQTKTLVSNVIKINPNVSIVEIAEQPNNNSSANYLIFLILIIIVIAIYLIIRRRKNKNSSDTNEVVIPIDSFQKRIEMLRYDDEQIFFGEAKKIFIEYLYDRYQIDQESMPSIEISKEIADRESNQERASKIINLLNDMDKLMFSNAAVTADLQVIKQRLFAIMQQKQENISD